MKELVADFVRDGGTYMILEAKEGLRPEQLNRVQRSMLAAVTVPNLLRLDIREIDYQISLHYDITGKRMLSQCLRSDKISMLEFYGLLLQVVAVLEDSKRYMLSPSGFLLDEAHIFVEEPLSSGALYFTYVPWKEAPTAPALSQALLSLMTRLLTCVSQVEGDGIPQLVRLCGDELFSLGELKKKLLRLLSGEPDVQAERDKVTVRGMPSTMAVNDPSSQLGEPSPSPARSAIVKEYMPVREPNELGTWAGVAETIGHTRVKREEWPGLDEEKSPREQKPLKPTYFVLGVLLADALAWKVLYFDRPGAVGLTLGVAATLLLGGGCFALWRKLRGSSTDMGEDADGTEKGSEGVDSPIGLSGLLRLSAEREGRTRPSSAMTEEAPLETFTPRVESSFEGRASAATSISAPTPRPAFTSASALAPVPVPVSTLSSLSQPETVLDDPEPEMELSPPTVLLSRSMLQGQGRPLMERAPRYYLERCEPAGTLVERIPLTTGSFVIGRSEEIAQYVEKTTGVSRAHVEILVTSRGCRLKDLGSKNGTRLNDEGVAPYKEYPLQAGDVFILAETSFKFGEEAS